MKRAVYVALQQFCESDDAPRRLLRETGFQVRENRLGRRLKSEEMAGLLAEADAVLAGVEPYDAALLERLPRLRCISRCGAGTDSVDLQAARRLGIAVLTTPEEVAEPVAELALGMILALARQLPRHLRNMEAGTWRKETGFLLSEWTIGLIGFGRVGRTLQRLLRPMGPQILISDPFLSADRIPPGLQRVPLEELLARSDVVSLHASRRPEEGALLGKRELAQMKPGSFLVNTSRGHLVNEAALLEALEVGRLAGAALDVFEEEPYQGPLSRMPQVLCTPHVATLTRASRAAMELKCVRNVLEFFGHR